MAIRAVIFDVGGVLIDIDWTQYRKDEQLGVPVNDIRSYEQLNTALSRFVVDLRPRYKTATICNGGSREAVNRKFRLGELVDLMILMEKRGSQARCTYLSACSHAIRCAAAGSGVCR